jgi:RNA polymerase sigma-70 factor (ECF subfamily)
MEGEIGQPTSSEPDVGPLQRAESARVRSETILLAYEAHQRELATFAYAVTRDADAVEDLVQESFLRLVREVSEGRTPTNVRAWLYRVCGNLAVTRARRRAVVDRVSRFFGAGVNEASADIDVLRNEAAHALSVGLTFVAPEARVALVMAAHGFSGREIAASIGRSETATRALMFRAREKLRVHLVREGVYP